MPELPCSPKVTTIITGASIIAIVVSSILIALSMKKVNYDELGLKYATASRVIKSEDAFGPGKYFVGLGVDFHRFPSTWQQIIFADKVEYKINYPDGKDDETADTPSSQNLAGGIVSVRTADKFINKLEIAFQYSLVAENLYMLFDQYKFDYEQYFVRDALGVFSEIGPQYMAEDFFTKRNEFEQSLTVRLRDVLSSKHAKLEGLQLLDVKLDPKIEEQLLSNEVRKESNVLITLGNELTVNKTFWEREIVNVNADVARDLDFLREETKQLVEIKNLAIQTVRKNTETFIKKIEAETDKMLVTYRQETENLRLAIDSNVTLIKKTTEFNISDIEAKIALDRGAHEAELSRIKAEAASNVTRLIKAAEASVQEARESLYPKHRSEVAEMLELSPEDSVRLEWMTTLGDLDNAQIFVDYKKPIYGVRP